VDPNNHWQAGVLVTGWSYDVEVQTIFGLLIADLIASITHTLKGIVGSRQSPSPGRVQCLGIGKAELFKRRLCEWDTKEEVLVVLAVVHAIV
jgi:hypothetical protein